MARRRLHAIVLAWGLLAAGRAARPEKVHTAPLSGQRERNLTEEQASGAAPMAARGQEGHLGPPLVELHVQDAVGSWAEFARTFVKAFTLMCAAEIFDRTWFVALLCSLRHGATVSFCGSITALGLHSVIAVSFGEGVGSFLPQWVMEVASALILGVFALVYAWESYKAEGDDALRSRREEAEEDVTSDVPSSPPQDGDKTKAGDEATSSGGKATFWASFVTIFCTIFIAEWGDRTQIVQITLASSLPWLPVILGSFSGLILLCLSAVMLARFMEGKKVSERLLNSICALSFGLMAALASKSARHEFLVSRATAAGM